MSEKAQSSARRRRTTARFAPQDLLPALGLWLNELQRAGARCDVSHDPGAQTVIVTFHRARVTRTDAGALRFEYAEDGQ